MKKIFTIALLTTMFILNSVAFSYEITNDQKNAIYDLFISTYLASAEYTIQTSQLSPEQKQKVVNFTKQNVNKQQLMNETWGCLKTKLHLSDAEMQTCFAHWAKKQSADLIDFMARMN